MIGRHKFSVENFKLLTMIFSEHFLSVEIFFLSGNGPSDVYSYPTVLIMQGQNGKDNQKQPFKLHMYVNGVATGKIFVH